MRIFRFGSMAMAIALSVFSTHVQAEDAAAPAAYCESGSAPAHSYFADVEALAFRLNTSAGTGEDDALSYDLGYRVALGRVNCEGIGARLSYFEFNTAGTDNPVGDIDLQSFNLDFEVFKQLDICDGTSLEFGGGLRYNDVEHNYDGGPNDFNGVGVIVGFRAGYKLCDGGMLFARGKWANIMGNGAHDGDDESLDPAFDVIRSQTELAFGYEHAIDCGCATITPRFAYEVQNWENYGIDPVDEHPDNSLGIGGFVAGLGVQY